MQSYHNENNIPFNKGNKLTGSSFGKEILSYTLLLKWYLQQGLKLSTPEKIFQQLADEV